MQAELQEVPKAKSFDLSGSFEPQMAQMEAHCAQHKALMEEVRKEQARQRQQLAQIDDGKASWEEQRLNALQDHLEALPSHA